MANTLITSDVIAATALEIIHNHSALLPIINREYDDSFANSGAKVGDTIRIRKPVQFRVRRGATAQPQDVTETNTSLTIQPEIGVDWEFSDRDLTLSIDKFAERYLEPAGKRLATEIDMSIIRALYTTVPNMSGAYGTPASSVADLLAAAKVLDNQACPRDGNRWLITTPDTNAAAVAGMGGLFNDQNTIGKQNKSGVLVPNVGMKFRMSQNLPVHTVGPLGGTPLVNGANQGVTPASSTANPYAPYTDLVTDGWTAAAALRLKAGDVITIAGVYDVNPEHKEPLKNLKQFVVMEDVSSNASGQATVRVYPALIDGGAYQTVTALPADNAAITVFGEAGIQGAQNILLHKDAFTFATADMEIPKGVDMASRMVYDGVSLRFVRDYQVMSNSRICRFDILAGWAALRPEWAVRIPE